MVKKIKRLIKERMFHLSYGRWSKMNDERPVLVGPQGTESLFCEQCDSHRHAIYRGEEEEICGRCYGERMGYINTGGS